MEKFANLTDAELIKETHRLAGVVSYFNAAEGNWSQERAEREAAKAEFWAAQSEMSKRSLEFENRGYLI